MSYVFTFVVGAALGWFLTKNWDQVRAQINNLIVKWRA